MVDEAAWGVSSEVFRHLPFPFDDGVFPANLGAVVQRTVLDGREPAREVIHDADGDWLVGDGVNDPNLPGASSVAHMTHVIELDPTVAALANLPVGHIATREEVGEEWVVDVHRWDDD